MLESSSGEPAPLKEAVVEELSTQCSTWPSKGTLHLVHNIPGRERTDSRQNEARVDRELQHLNLSEKWGQRTWKGRQNLAWVNE